MALSEQDQLLIKKSLEDKLSPQEEILFEERKNDTDFVKELSLQKEIRDLIFTEGRNKIRSIIQGFEEEYQSKRPKSMRRSTMRFSQAAALLILVGLGLWWLLKPAGTSQLFAQYYAPFSNVVDPLTKGQPEGRSPYQLYELAQYPEALEGLQEVADSEERYFYEGLIKLEMHAYAQANVAFENALSYEGDLQSNIEWYLLMTQLALSNSKQSLSMARLISENNSHPYQTEAREILKEIE